ncbi:D-3-phosphoglycerate dehydrogenase [Noviherbaspirillum humi]|uniref:D-3-phosphoglycerate dehydrogenase n=1 Tax=Noviherbaspirillum humi TaxID=1688639 RepID=A0A239C8I8_9BURK|nr:D-2-hydroxyacid dehydrogenase family protein [Noviherbaspirillum humi]SNS16565.1 D-3-phosphoglycerate dehydrogenase [Noviherbaspirillum humi]
MRIAIPDDYQNVIQKLDCFSVLQGHEVTVYHDTVSDIDQLAARFADAECLVLTRERTRITAELLERLPKLKLISQTGKAGEHIDLKACTARGVAVVEGFGSPVAPAELTWALIMASRRHLVQSAQDMKQGKWQTTIGTALHGQRLGIWSYGKIGKMIAGYGKAFGMRVWAWGGEKSRQAAIADGFEAAPSREAFFRESDVISLHIRLLAATRGIVTLQDLQMMKPDALITNTSRAELIAPGALEAALSSGRPGFAAIDVYEQEPMLDPDHPLLQMPNVLCTPHLGYVEKNGYELYFGTAFRNVLDFAAGTPKNVANPEVLGKA